MYFKEILHDSKDYGKGNRVVLLMGTRENGITFEAEEVVDVFQELEDKHVDGLTIAGDEPLSSQNIPLLTELCKACKECAPTKTIYCYTGLKPEEVQTLDIMKYIDGLQEMAVCA